jgi:hypothetical protein
MFSFLKKLFSKSDSGLKVLVDVQDRRTQVKEVAPSEVNNQITDAVTTKKPARRSTSVKKTTRTEKTKKPTAKRPRK